MGISKIHLWRIVNKSIILIISYLLAGLSMVLAEDFDNDRSRERENSLYPRTGLVERPDDIDKEEYNIFPLLGRSLYLKGEVQFASEFMGNYALKPKTRDHLLEIEPTLVVECFYPLSAKASVYLEGEAQFKSEYDSETKDRYDRWIFERVESWIFVGDIQDSGLSIQLGRQNYEDERQWWWDERLDSIRLHYDEMDVHSEIGIARELGPESTEHGRIEPEKEDIFRVLTHTAWRLNDALRFDLFGLYQNDCSSRPEEQDTIQPDREDESDADLLWYGARFSGEVEAGRLGDFDYWIDTAGLTGNEKRFEFEETDDGVIEVTGITAYDASGWAVDAGITWKTGVLRNMELTLGYALGSGDNNPEDNKDKSFRQTGLNEGDNRFQYYGEVFNPELSNMRIQTASLGFHLTETCVIDLIYHHYSQVHPASFMREKDIEADPQGLDESLGEEWDLVANAEAWENIEIETSASFFRSGDAFGDFSGDTAYRLNFEITYQF